MKDFFKFTLASIVGFFVAFFIAFGLLFLIVFSITVASLSSPDVQVNKGSILHVKLDKTIEERVSDNPMDYLDPFSMSINRPLSLKRVIDNIDRAAEDDNIEGILLDVSFIPARFSMIQEIRNALENFKVSGKFIYSYADLYMQLPYYLATVSDSVIMLPDQGMFDFRGFASEQMFLRGALDKLDIEPMIFTAGEYKSAGEFLDRYQMSDENRQQIQELLDSYLDEYLQVISKSRGIEKNTLKDWMDRYSVRYPEQALDHGLIDVLWYRDELIEFLKERIGQDNSEELQTISLQRYSRVKGLSPRQQKGKGADGKIALIYGVGPITISSGGRGDEIIGEQFSKEIRKAREDDDIKAIVVRINSPGGSALASDVIWREIRLAAEEKPVVASMSGLAASGGYYIASAADHIYATPTTLTGSIGVIGMLLNMEKFWENKLGIRFDRVKTGNLSDFGNPNRQMLPEEKEIISEFISRVYDDFIDRVAEGRDMDPNVVRSLAGGKVYSGRDAHRNGLVDDIGGLYAAVDKAAELAGIEKYRLQVLPKPGKPLEKFLEEFTQSKREKVLKNELGTFYEAYNYARFFNENPEPMAIMPYHLEIR